MSIRISAPWFLIPCILIVPVLRADVIYTNFGTGDAYSSGAGLIVTSDNTAWASVALAFTPLANYDLTSIRFVASEIVPDDLGVSIGIFADNGGLPGGLPLESLTLRGPLAQFGSSAPILTVSSLLQPLLQANMQYWIGLSAPAGDVVVWNQSVTLSLGFASTDGSGNWSASNLDQGVVEINGTLVPDVPEPLLTHLVNSPLGPIPSQTEDSTDSTPEPGTWTFLTCSLVLLAATHKKIARFPNQE